MKVLDLFSGIGGFSVAAHWHGWETVAFVEKEPFCHKVLEKNFKGVPIYDNIFTFDGRPFAKSVDVICGGFPCQPFSVAGKRAGVEDERHLFPETLRVISEVRPAWVILENVTGLITIPQSSRTIGVARQANHRHEDEDVYEAVYTFEDEMLLNRICEELENEGYAVAPVVIPAEAVGAPHRRDRIWIVARADASHPGREYGEEQTDAGKPSEAVRQQAAAESERSVGRDAVRDAPDAENARVTWRERVKTDDAGSGVGGSNFRGTGNGTYGNQDAADTDGAGLQGNSTGRSLQGWQIATGRARQGDRNTAHRDHWRTNWLDVALRTCVRDVDDGLPRRLLGFLNAHYEQTNIEGGNSSPVAATDFINWRNLCRLREYAQTTTPSSRLYVYGLCDRMPEMSSEEGSGRWVSSEETTETMRGLWERFSAESFTESQDVREQLLEYLRQIERNETLVFTLNDQQVSQLWGRVSKIEDAADSLREIVRQHLGVAETQNFELMTRPQWRTGALKALGNSILPQVAYELFRAIRIAEGETVEDNEDWPEMGEAGNAEMLPTPDTMNHRDGTKLRKDNNLVEGGSHGVSLHHKIAMLPTPLAEGVLGARDNRAARLKALGNAIVPQVAYEIFAAIKQADAKTQEAT